MTYENKKPKTISINRTALVKEHWLAISQIIGDQDPRWKDRTGKVLSINLTTYPLADGAVFTIDNQELFFLSNRFADQRNSTKEWRHECNP